jgi:uncharacterized LabA/DUF88 family protein
LYNKKLNRIIKYGGNIILITTITEKKFYTHEDLLVAISKLPEKELEEIWKHFDFTTLLGLVNVKEESRTLWKNQMLEFLHKELDRYNAIDRLFGMLPVIDNKLYEKMEQGNENACSNSACDKTDGVVE